jgi:lipoprotein-anchoring transpeptidase ErfK/SrfK
MKTQFTQLLLLTALVILSQTAGAKSKSNSFTSQLCQQSGYECYKVKKGETWAKLFPNEEDRLVVKKINRMNTPLFAGKTIALPTTGVGSHMDHAPFPSRLDDDLGGKAIVIDLSDLAFGAYNENGELENWGPISTGKSYCADIGRGCSTPTGSFAIYTKQGAGCKSTKYPVGKGGAPMPYCMFFKGGFALHGSPTVPGYNDSHGCVRLFTDDARWLNQEFSNGSRVKVIIRR